MQRGGRWGDESLHFAHVVSCDIVANACTHRRPGVGVREWAACARVLRKRSRRAARTSARMRDSGVPSQKPCPFSCSSSSGYSSGSDLMSQYWWPGGLADWAGPFSALTARGFAAFSALAVTGFPCCKRRAVCSHESPQQLRVCARAKSLFRFLLTSRFAPACFALPPPRPARAQIARWSPWAERPASWASCSAAVPPLLSFSIYPRAAPGGGRGCREGRKKEEREKAGARRTRRGTRQRRW